MISARRRFDVSIDGAQVSTPSGPCRFCSLTGEGDRWRRGRDSAYPAGGAEEAWVLSVSGWDGRAGDCRGQWAGRWLTVIGHGEDGDLSDGSTPALHAARPLVDGGQVSVHVPREASAPGNLLSGS